MEEKKEDHPFARLAAPARRALAGAGIKTLQRLAALTEAEFMQLHGIGKNAAEKVKKDMAANGLSFADKG